MGLTALTPQQVVNRLYGSPDTKYTEQEISNFRNGTYNNAQSWQRILNENLQVSPTFYSLQVALFYTLQSELGLTGSPTRYSVQELLNLAYQGGIPIDNVEGEVDGLGNFGLLYLMAIA